MCGLVGYVGDKPADINAIKILGMYNTTRGTDSCGISINNKVTKGVDKVANFSNFIENFNLGTSSSHNNYTILAHTRNASQKNTKDDAECAHPFEIKNKRGKTILIGAHNGVIYNDDDLAKKYNVKQEKVDSKTLLSIIAKAKTDDKMYKVLEDYEGAAVLIWFYPEEPNSLYIWKGASKSYSTSTTFNEDRSLYIYRVKDEKGKFTNQYYISSIKESLLAIGGELSYRESDVNKEPSVTNIEVNSIINIKPGEKIKIRPIKRDNVSNSYSTNYYNQTSSCGITTYPAKSIVKYNKQESMKEKMLATFLNYPFKKVNKTPILDNTATPIIDNEPFIHDFHKNKNKIYFHRGRYWQNGHMIGGSDFDKVVTREVDIEGYPKGTKECDETSLDTYYFFQGLLLTGKSDCLAIEKLLKDNLVWEDRKKKKLALHNIRQHVYGFCQNIGDTTGSARANGVGHWATGTFYPMFDYSKKYIYENGNFKKAEYTNTPAVEKINIWKKLSPEKSNIIPLTQPVSNENNKEINEEILNHCYDVLSSVKAAVQKMEPLKDDPKYSQIYKLLNGNKGILTNKLQKFEETKEKSFTLTNETGILYT